MKNVHRILKWTAIAAVHAGIALSLISCTESEEETAEIPRVEISSPGKVNQINFELDANGVPSYQVTHNGKVVVRKSTLGITFKDQSDFTNGLRVIKQSSTSIDEKWEMPWGEQREVLNRAEETTIALEDTLGRKLNLVFRAYDDGVAFRYEIPAMEGVDTVMITAENSEFNMTGDHMAYWTPGDWDSYEYPINTCKLSEIDAPSKDKNDGYWKSMIPENSVHTPFTMVTEEGIHLSIHEANLTNYAGMTVKVGEENKLISSLVGSKRMDGKAKAKLPFKTPWRTIQISDNAAGLIESNLIVNLNEPNKLGDVSWFKPMKYVGIWWEMHIGTARWDMEAVKEGARHGATTENTKKYIDFAAENGFGGVLVEGWNTGWDRWIGFPDREGVFDFVTPYPDYDLEGLAAYGKEKGVQIIMHNETSAAINTYIEQMDTAYKLMESLGIHAVKTGYVGPVLPEGEYHHGQWMVNHYRSVLEKGAEHQVAINVHEPIKPTGIRRTYPNAISREGARGQEYNAWSADGGNPAEHNVLLAFTRLLAGPMDFTPGVFDIALPTKPDNQINTTLAQQLTLYVVLYSPVQMACDLPENYQNQPGLQFIKDVAVDWEQTKVLDGSVGDHVVLARQERGGEKWFIGAITDENEKETQVNFDFLPEGKKYKAILYRDGDNAHYESNPIELVIEEFEVDKHSLKTVVMREGGGFALSVVPL